MGSVRFAFVLLFSIPGWSQIVTGSIAGSVEDPSGLSVPNAEVTLTQSATARARTMQTNEGGDFLFSGLDAGNYTLTISGSGFKKYERRDIILATGERLPLEPIRLEVGALTETVSVTAQGGAIVQTQSAERADVITSAQVDSLLIRGRNVKDLVALLPGVVVRNTADDLANTSNFSVMGNRQTFNNIAVDGVPATDMGNGYQMKLVVSQEAVSEVKILISNYTAEYGRMAGSNIQIVTKSGTRDFHGLGSYFKRHEQFNANNFFDNLNGIKKPRYRFNTWTYNVGGPVLIPGKFNTKREKLFFFWHQEFWPTKNFVTGQRTMPTPLEKEGNFSQSLDVNNRLITIKDPYNNNVLFPGNIIPASRIDRNGQVLLKVFHDPNFPNRDISRGQYNYTFVSENDMPKRTSTLKLDYNLSSNNFLSGGFSAWNEDQTAYSGAAQTANWPQMKRTWWSHSKSLTARYTRIISPAVINEFSFGFLTQPAENSYEEEELRRNLRETVGYTIGQFSPSANPLKVIPNATFGGVPNAGQLTFEGRFPLYNRYRLFNWSDNLTITRGSHTFKAGLYIETFFRHQKKAVPFNGSFDFGRNVNNPLDTNYAYANAALGVFNSYTETSGAAWMKQRTGGYEWFLQDSWKAKRRLTVELGLRMHYTLPIVEEDNFLAGFVPSRYDPARAPQLIRPGLNARGQRIGVHPVTGQEYTVAQIGAIAPGVGNPYNGMVRGGEGGYPRALVNQRGIQWGPRIGFAYDVFGNGKTAIRGGFGMFYNRFFTEGFAGPITGQPPLLESPVVSFGEMKALLSSSGLVFPSNVVGADVQGYLPTVMNFSLSVQRDIGFGTVLDVGYGGSLGRHLLWRRDVNPIPLGANFDPNNADRTLRSGPLPSAFLRRYIGFNEAAIMEGASSSSYHSLQVQAKRRFIAGLQFGLAWTWSKALDFNDADSDSVSALVPVRVWNYGLANFDRTHVLNVNYIWDVPGVNTNNPVGRQALNGWQLSGITSFISGAPLGVGFSTVTATDITGSASQGARVVVTGNPVLPKSERTFSRNFRTEVFQLPLVGTVGNAAKTVIRGPGINNWDVAVFKNFRIHERMRLQFRWELYNFFNHTQFSALDTGARFDASGSQVNSRFGQFTGAYDPRTMQFALRVSF
ncbi:MAG: carboxypeptidase regulatory-like domain-containing protein [Bryobacteraceae bacterium]